MIQKTLDTKNIYSPQVSLHQIRELFLNILIYSPKVGLEFRTLSILFNMYQIGTLMGAGFFI